MNLRPARPADAPEIVRLLDHYASQGLLLHRPLSEVVSRIRDFSTVESNGLVVGIVALHPVSPSLAEIRSLAVAPGSEGKGIGRALVESALSEAQRLGLGRVFALTYRSDFFSRLGFHVVDKRELPQKIWNDCIHCSKFSDCDETAVLYGA